MAMRRRGVSGSGQFQGGAALGRGAEVLLMIWAFGSYACRRPVIVQGPEAQQRTM